MRMSAGVFATLMLLVPASALCAAGEDYLLYAPKAAESSMAPAGPDDGVLVKGVIIKRGDTLAALARKYRGKSSYFPQILLFNRIKNPDLIHFGARLLIPVTEWGAVNPAVEKKTSIRPRASAAEAQIHAPLPPVQPLRTVKHESDAAQRLYQKGVKAYKKGEYQRALNAFDRFLATFPASPLAADASLHRADCLLNLSGE
jgi:tetratricopeptide (TPR) repeat protein